MAQDELSIKIFNEVMDIKDQMVKKDEFEQKHSAIIGHIDGFIKLHQTLDIELVALREKHSRLEERVSRVERKIGILV